MSANGSLIIESAKKDDNGQYMCTAKNAVGKKTYSFSLDLQLPVEGKFVRYIARNFSTTANTIKSFCLSIYAKLLVKY